MAKTVRWFSCSAILLLSLFCIASYAQTAPQYPDYPSETPQVFHASTYGMDYARREAMIPMRDGVRLHTVILIPNGAKHAGILLMRTLTTRRC